MIKVSTIKSFCYYINNMENIENICVEIKTVNYNRMFQIKTENILSILLFDKKNDKILMSAETDGICFPFGYFYNKDDFIYKLLKEFRLTIKEANKILKSKIVELKPVGVFSELFYDPVLLCCFVTVNKHFFTNNVYSLRMLNENDWFNAIKKRIADVLTSNLNNALPIYY